jgi:hypothetical protein
MYLRTKYTLVCIMLSCWIVCPCNAVFIYTRGTIDTCWVTHRVEIRCVHYYYFVVVPATNLLG